MPAGPFLTSRTVGTSEAANYCLALADAVTQLRAGVVPPLVGQTPYAFNGRIHPLRNAPYMFYLAGALDLVSGRRLTFWQLPNFSLALSLFAAAFACYLGLRWGTGCGRGFALVLAAAYAWCPGLLVAADAQDLFMTVYAAPFLPLALGACLRQVRQPGVRPDQLMAAALAAAWLAHPPVALWTTAALGLLRLAILARQPSARSLGGLVLAAVLFLALAGFGFVSAGTLTQSLSLLAPGGAFKADYARVVFGNLRDAFPAVLLPISHRVSDLGNLQLGYAHWLLLAFAVAGLGRPRSGNGPGWDARRVSSLALVAGALLLVIFCLPIPILTPALWVHLPPAVHLLTNIWPMQRLYLVATALIVFAAALTRTDLWPRGTARLLIVAGLGWTLWEARPFLANARALQASPAATAVSHDDANIDLSVAAYSFFGLPRDYTAGVIDPLTQLRLISVQDDRVVADLTQPVLDRAPVVQEGVFRRIAPDRDQLAPALTLAPGKRYLLQLDFLTAPTRVYLKFTGERLQRSYRLPDAGGEAGFGMAPQNGHTLGLWTDLDHPETVSVEIPAWSDGTPDQPKADEFARFTLREVDPASLPVRLDSYVPLRCTVDVPRDGLYLETFREYLPGYTARVDDRAVAVQRSPGGKVMVPLPPGRSEVRVSFPGSPLLIHSFWISAGAWFGFVLWLAGAWGGLAVAARWTAGWPARRWLPLGLAVVALVGGVLAWPHAPPAPAAMGPVRVRFLLPLGETGKNLPVVVLGHAGLGAIVFLNPIDAEHVRVGADVWGLLFESKPIPVQYDQIQELIVSGSALYPPDDPRVRALDPATVQRLRGELRVDLDGANVLDLSHPPNLGETSDIHLGENPIGGSFAGPRFTGDMVSSDRLPIPQSLTLGPGQVVRLRLDPSPMPGRGREPVLTLAGDGKAAVVYAVRESPRLVRVGFFSFDGSWDEKGDLPLDKDGTLALEIRAGRTGHEAFPSVLAIDGLGRHLLGPQEVRPLLEPLAVTTGRNLKEGAAVNAAFAGPSLRAEVDREPAAGPQFGAYDLIAAFPQGRSGRAEPLVVTGKTGAGDLVYVVYVDAHHVRFGLEHWGLAGALGDPVPVDYDAHHEIEISLGSLYPAEESPEWADWPAAVRQERKSRLSVLLDGRSVLEAPLTAYPAIPSQVTVGANRIGASSCGLEFGGELLWTGRQTSR